MGCQETQRLSIPVFTATLAAVTLETKGAKDKTEEAEGFAISAACWPKSCLSKQAVNIWGPSLSASI